MGEKQGTSQIAEEIANEVYRLVTSRLRTVEELRTQMKLLDEKIEKQIKNFNILITQIERAMAEKKEEPTKQDDYVLNLANDIRTLKNEISNLKLELKNLKEKRSVQQL